MQDYDGDLWKLISLFLSSWRLELEKSFVGNSSLLDVLFEKFGSTLFTLNLQKFEYQVFGFGKTSVRRFFDSRSPTTFVIFGPSGFGKKYLLSELFSSFLKIGNCPQLQLCRFITSDICFSELIECCYANNCATAASRIEDQLIHLTEEGRRLKVRYEKLSGFSLILVHFRNLGALMSLIGISCSKRDLDDLYFSRLIMNLITKYTKIWFEEGIPIVSFVICDDGSNDNPISFQYEPFWIEQLISENKSVCKVDLNVFINQADKLTMFRHIINKRYGLQGNKIDNFMANISSYILNSMSSLSSEDFQLILDEVDLIYLNDMINKELNSLDYSNCCRISLDSVNYPPSFFESFPNHFETAVIRLNDKGWFTKYLPERTVSVARAGLKNIIGCEDVIMRIENIIFPCIYYTDLLDLEIPIVCDLAPGVVICGDRGCGKSYLANSIVEEIDFGKFTIYAADLYNSNIGYIEWYLNHIVRISVRKREVAIIFEDIDQYLDDGNLYPSLLLFFDIISRSNKWASTRILIFGTVSSVNPSISTDIYQVSIESAYWKAMMINEDDENEFEFPIILMLDDLY
ncbi:Spermatogenesis-associated protein 5 [Cryptosporidium felis]|nr:Spermatogenesis-associated protein 5 [Cryptosporidium felis]